MQQGEYSNGATRRSFENEVVDELRTQLEEVLQQNRDLAIRLSDEQRLCARLHQSLCDTQQEHFLTRAEDGQRPPDDGKNVSVRHRLAAEEAQAECQALRKKVAEQERGMVALRNELGAANGALSSEPPGQATQWRAMFFYFFFLTSG